MIWLSEKFIGQMNDKMIDQMMDLVQMDGVNTSTQTAQDQKEQFRLAVEAMEAAALWVSNTTALQ